jgi:hypothetical protein
MRKRLEEVPMRRATAVLPAVALLAIVVCPSAAAAQGALAGIVRDASGTPLPQVDVRALTQDIATRTDSLGRFVLSGLEPAWHRVLFRRIGYDRLEMEYAIDRVGTRQVEITLTRLPETLAAVVVRARRWTGVYGSVGDVRLQPLGGVQVELMGSSRHVTTTDSAGRYRLPDLPAGNHIVLVRRRGYYPVLRSLTLEAGEARELSLALGPLPSRSAASAGLAGFGGRMDFAWGEHASRRVRCAGPRAHAALVTREELASLGRQPLLALCPERTIWIWMREENGL